MIIPLTVDSVRGKLLLTKLKIMLVVRLISVKKLYYNIREGERVKAPREGNYGCRFIIDPELAKGNRIITMSGL